MFLCTRAFDGYHCVVLPESANLKEELKNNARGDHLSELFIESGEQKTLDVLEIGPIEFSFIKGKNK